MLAFCEFISTNTENFYGKGGENLQSKHSRSRSLKLKVVAPVLAAVLVASGIVPAVTAGMHSASAASVDGETGASTTYNAPVNANNNDNKNNIFWTKATYYDYLTDDEVVGGWINGIKKYGTGFNGSADEWFPYYIFNRSVVKAAADRDSNWTTPLYFGNFCNTPGAFDTSGHHNGAAAGYDSDGAKSFKDATNSYNVTRFNYAANNSNGLSNMHQSYQGLMQNTLDANGNLMATGTLKAPYFDPDQLGDHAKVVNSQFPFRTSDENGVTKYEFDSTGGKDNVYFDWSNGQPVNVNYGGGESYAVRDGLRYFMYEQGSGYGIFPFNNRGTTKTVTKPTGTRYVYLSKGEWTNGWGGAKVHFTDANGQTVGSDITMSWYNGNWRAAIPANAVACKFYDTNNTGYQTPYATDLSKAAFYYKDDALHLWSSIPNDAGIGASVADNEALDYGFGIKTEMNFRVPAGGVDNAGNPITFEYSGDDDLWVYITEIGTNNSQLVLDLGGNHKQAKGTINFKDRTATANDVYNKGKQTKSFTFDYSKSYKMSIFYMERGMLESNCKMAFTMVPLGNSVTVTETINTTDINSGLTNAVKALDSFRFTPTAGANATDPVPNLTYLTESGATQSTSNSYFDLKSGGAAHFNTFFTTGDKIKVTQSKVSNSYLIYDCKWTYTDKVGNQGTNNGTTNATGVKQLINSTTNPDTFEFAELQADFVNTPKSAPVTITKTVTELDSGETDNTEFGGTVYVDLGDGFKTYNLAYTTSDGGSATLTSAGKLADSAKLKNGRTLTFAGIPQGAKVRFVEDDTDEEYQFLSVMSVNGIVVGSDGIVVGSSDNAMTVTNKKLKPGEISVPLTAKKTLENASLTDGAFEFELLDSNKNVIETKSCTATGDVTFRARNYTGAANETYYIREKVPAASNDSDMQSYDTSEYKVSIVVTKSGLTLTPKVTYYKNGRAVDEGATFVNTVKLGEAYVIKSDTAGRDVTGVEFAIYQVDGEGASLAGKSPLQTATTASMDITYSNGSTKNQTAVHFTNLPLYADNNYNADNTQRNYQWYAIAETDPTTGYYKNNTVVYFQLPKSGSYEPKFDYVNGHILSPNYGFGGMFGFKMIGVYAITFAALMGAAYLFYTKRNRRRARHIMK